MREKLTKLFGSHLINLDMLPDDAVIIDAGACVGRSIQDIQERVKDPYIFAIEPSADNYEILRRSRFKQTILINAALVGGKEQKEMRFYHINGLPEWGNVTGLYTNKSHLQYIVETINLKNLLGTIPLETIHYLKMDIEGSEWDVVNDMNEETTKRIEQISMEIHSHQEEIIEKLETIGYEIFYEKGELYAIRKEL